MTIAKKVAQSMERASWIRKMFEEGAKLKAEFGAENVFDFSLGNPNVEPPQALFDAMADCIQTKGTGLHGYMPNPGYPDVRAKVAEFASGEQGVELTANEIIMTCGAAGALNVVLKSLLDPGDEVLTPRPFFAEYNFYADNHGGALATVATTEDFSLDMDAMEKAVNEKTKVVLVNSPNNPTGQVYSKESLQALGALLEKKSAELGRTIYLVSDEPYRKLIYDGIEVPGILSVYKNSIVANSYSKDLSVPGERIGWLAVHPQAESKAELLGAMTLANRILGFVNAPALMQRVVGAIQGQSVDTSQYTKKRDLLCDGLKKAGYDFPVPKGAFYLFCKSPIEDDVAFVAALQEEKILAVPGTGFGGPGYFRIAFCVADETIEGALPGFARVLEKYK